MSAGSWKRAASAFLQRQTDTQRAVNAACDPALPFQHGGISPQEIAEPSRAHRKNRRTEKAQYNKDDSEDR
jgi:hypothetical protein